jgi:4-hydroxy-2-oxoglutarate aldolase
MTKKVSGVFAPISTPFIDDEVSFDRFKENVIKYSQTPLNGYLVLGSNGESKSLTEDEKLKLLEIVLQEKAAQQLVMAGTGYESTRQTIVFSKKAQELGADLVSLVSPSYFKKSLTDEALIGYYTQVAEALSIPVFAYNAPGFTGLTISAAVIETISQHPNIGGMKDTSPAGLASYLEVCGDDFDILAGSMNTLFIGLSLGASGGVISLANAFPEACCALYEAFTGGDVATARQVHSRLFRLNKAVSGASGVAGVKYAMELGGYHGGDPRLPLLPIKDADKQRIKNAAEAAGVL